MFSDGREEEEKDEAGTTAQQLCVHQPLSH